MNENKSFMPEVPASFKTYSLQETADILHVTTRTLLTYLKEGKLKGQKIGGNWRISERNLQRFIDGD